MLPDQIKNFRHMTTLKDGVHILLRPVNGGDYQHLMEFYTAVEEEGRCYLGYYVQDPALIREECNQMDFGKVLPVLAFFEDQVVGAASIYFGEGPKRHIGEVRLFLADTFQNSDLDIKMIHVLIDLARKQGLSILIAEVLVEQTKVVKAFEMLGFNSQAVLDDYFLFPDGETREVVFLTMYLRSHTEDF